jgi:hypothetical protein
MSWFSVFGASLIAAMLFALIVARPVAAQEATPAVDLSPNPEECTVEPRILEDLQALVGTPAPEGAGEATMIALAASPVPFELPTGEPADEATIAAITAVLRQQFACYNAGEGLRGLALLTDDFIISQVGLAVFDEDLIAFLIAEPVPLPEEQQTQLLGVREVTLYTDGRVGALVDYFGPTSPPDSLTGFETDLNIYEQQPDGRWLLDEVVENLEGQHGP